MKILSLPRPCPQAYARPGITAEKWEESKKIILSERDDEQKDPRALSNALAHFHRYGKKSCLSTDRLMQNSTPPWMGFPRYWPACLKPNAPFFITAQDHPNKYSRPSGTVFFPTNPQERSNQFESLSRAGTVSSVLSPERNGSSAS